MTDSHSDPTEFPIATRKEWREAVERVLKGRAFEEILVSEAAGGLDIQPLYTSADVSISESDVPFDEARIASGWDVRQRHLASDPAAANAEILEDLANGVTSVEVAAPPSGWSSESLHTVVSGVLLDLAPVVLAPHSDLDSVRAFAALIDERGDSESAASWLGLDPIGEVARGGTPVSLSLSLSAAAAVGADIAPRLPAATVFTVDSTRYGDAGAAPVQEMAWALATGVAYLRALEAAGLTVTQAASTIGFRSTAGADQFTTIAQMRAARRLWNRVLHVCGVPADQRHHQIQAVTARSMFSRRDPWVNMLRCTSAALGAGLGGADSITVLPFDTAIGASDRFGRRNARNIQLVLIEESQLGHLVDPASGSWFVESLTNRLADEAWAAFQRVEASGGMEAALGDGSVAAAIDEAWSTRLGRLAHRAEQITGVTEFPDLEGAPLDHSGDMGTTETSAKGLPLRRLAAPFEELRDASDRASAESGRRPTVCLVTLGELSVHSGRSTWITNLLAVGGIATVGGDDDGANSPLQAEAEFTDSSCAVAVICSSDGVYTERAVATATALKEAGATFITMAGHPSELADQYRAAGVDEFWHQGIDILDTLRRLHFTLGIG